MGMMPLANRLLADPQDPDPEYPLRVMVCDVCLLVQALPIVSPANIFSDYPFFSGQTAAWRDHCRAYVAMVMGRFAPKRVIEIASNDGTLLKEFPWYLDILGIEPAANVAEIARAQEAVPTRCAFWDSTLARDVEPADLIVANNVLAHTPDLNDFIAGIAVALKPEGVCTVEFPALSALVDGLFYDTIYHEHFSYLSCFSAEQAFARHGLRLFDVEEIGTHGGSLRLYLCHRDAGYETERSVMTRLFWESQKPAHHPWSCGFAEKARAHADRFRVFLEAAKGRGELVVGAGASAKAATLLNYAGIDETLLPFVTDGSPHKQDRFLPGSHIPIVSHDAAREFDPDRVVVFSWNWFDEIRGSVGVDAEYVNPALI